MAQEHAQPATVADVMTTEVITVNPETPIRDIADLLYTRRISGVPVVDADRRLLGIVGEGDLIMHASTIGEQRPAWWLKLLAGDTRLASDYARAHGRIARDVMRTRVITISETTTIADAARLFHKHQIKRLPVLRDGRLVGIITRSDLLKVLASPRATPRISLDDRAIRQRLIEHLSTQPWTDLGTKNIIVEDGTVNLFGFVQNDDERQAIRVAAEAIPGVKSVEDHMVLEPHVPV
jgi:CBS domain-containing protein